MTTPAATPAAQPVLRLSGITKRFGPLVANDGISLELAAGEVLALLGENGAGKSTLVSILFGHYVADEGQVEAFGRPLPPGRPRAALEAGIALVHQHFTLAENLSVLDNVMLGTEPLWRPWSRRAAARQRLQQTAQRFGLGVDADARVADLSVGERQRVEILKTLVRGARVLILDEPTAVLTPQESESLFATLRQLVAQGLSIVFISHKLDEVLRVSHRVAVLRGGRLVATRPAAGTTAAELAELMVGRSVQRPVRREVQGTGQGTGRGAGVGAGMGECVCALQAMGVRGADRRWRLQDVTLALHAGRIVGIAGVSGNGQQALADVLCGLQPADAGSVLLLQDGQARQPAARARDWVAAGVARIPEDRQGTGAVGDLALWENAISEHLASPAVARAGWLRRRAAQAHAQRIVREFDVRGTEARGLATVTRALSGGNLQKLILGRALLGDPARPARPRLIVAAQPTWGLDVGAVAEVHRRLLDAAAAGAAVLLISDDLDELFALADEIAVLHQGRLTPPRPAAQWTQTDIGLAMAGSLPAQAPEQAPRPTTRQGPPHAPPAA
ncbi:MAG: ABC transporter ATP-binding protein [Burkholderiales bacterium]|nr:ABC transporter ATP-binding protein [Burkholderiales bacterium]